MLTRRLSVDSHGGEPGSPLSRSAVVRAPGSDIAFQCLDELVTTSDGRYTPERNVYDGADCTYFAGPGRR